MYILHITSPISKVLHSFHINTKILSVFHNGKCYAQSIVRVSVGRRLYKLLNTLLLGIGSSRDFLFSRVSSS